MRQALFQPARGLVGVNGVRERFGWTEAVFELRQIVRFPEGMRQTFQLQYDEAPRVAMVFREDQIADWLKRMQSIGADVHVQGPVNPTVAFVGFNRALSFTWCAHVLTAFHWDVVRFETARQLGFPRTISRPIERPGSIGRTGETGLAALTHELNFWVETVQRFAPAFGASVTPGLTVPDLHAS